MQQLNAVKGVIVAGDNHRLKQDIIQGFLKMNVPVVEYIVDPNHQQSLKDFLFTLSQLYSGRLAFIYLSTHAKHSAPLLEQTDSGLDSMLNEDIKPFLKTATSFIENRRQNAGGYFIHVINNNMFSQSRFASLANFAGAVQMEIINRLAAEASPYQIQVAQLHYNTTGNEPITASGKSYEAALAQQITAFTIQFSQLKKTCTKPTFQMLDVTHHAQSKSTAVIS